MSADKISIDEAKKNKLFYFVATVIVYRKRDSRCLILKRSMAEKVHPGKYTVPGGKLEWEDLDLTNPTRMHGEVIVFEDAVEELVRRETKEEAGIEVHDDLKFLDTLVFVRPDGIPVILFKFIARYKSGEVALEPEAFDDYAWVNTEEVKDYDCIGEIPDEIAEAIEIFKK